MATEKILAMETSISKIRRKKKNEKIYIFAILIKIYESQTCPFQQWIFIAKPV